jgi:glutaminyl-tRNA synthetase
VDIIRDQASGDILELRCTYDPESRGGSSPDQRRVRGTLHWVSASHSVAAEVRLYDHLFLNADPDDDGDGADFTEKLDPDSLTILTNCRVEPGLLEAAPGRIFQFERQGYFCVDSVDSNPERMVFNRAVALRDSWAKIARNQTAIQE